MYTNKDFFGMDVLLFFLFSYLKFTDVFQTINTFVVSCMECIVPNKEIKP